MSPAAALWISNLEKYRFYLHSRCTGEAASQHTTNNPANNARRRKTLPRPCTAQTQMHPLPAPGAPPHRTGIPAVAQHPLDFEVLPAHWPRRLIATPCPRPHERRRRTLRFLLGHVIEQAANVPLTPDSVIQAVRVFAHLDPEGRWVNPPKQLIIDRVPRTNISFLIADPTRVGVPCGAHNHRSAVLWQLSIPALRPACAMFAPRGTILGWAKPLAPPVLLRPSPTPRLLCATRPSSASLTGSPPLALLPSSSAEWKL